MLNISYLSYILLKFFIHMTYLILKISPEIMIIIKFILDVQTFVALEVTIMRSNWVNRGGHKAGQDRVISQIMNVYKKYDTSEFITWTGFDKYIPIYAFCHWQPYVAKSIVSSFNLLCIISEWDFSTCCAELQVNKSI